jgi:hypothetical protein
MKQLAVRFSETQDLKISDLSEVIDTKYSNVARAAMKLGLEQITALAAVDLEKARDLVLIADARAK